MRILYVDDDVEDREIFSEVMQAIDLSARCDYAFDGLQAELMLSNDLWASNLQFIFLDINMPKKNGIDVLKTIKQDSRLAHIPTIILSTSVHEKEIETIHALGAEYIAKDFNFARMVSLIAAVIHPENKILN
jgi:CheY-like chemotaxis protein